jgi:hypothetical protein
MPVFIWVYQVQQDIIDKYRALDGILKGVIGQGTGGW